MATAKDTPKKDVKKAAQKPVQKPAPKPRAAEKKAEARPKEAAITIQREAFQKAVSIASDFAEKKAGGMPVLTHVLLESDGNRHCKLTATDLNVAWTGTVSCKGQKVAKCIPAALLAKEVKALPPSVDEVVLKFSDNVVNINGRCRMFTLASDDFPVLPEIKDGKDLQIDNLVSALKKVSCAIGGDDRRLALKGVYLDFAAGKAVATDGHRLHYEDIRVRGAKPKPLILPRKAVALMARYPAERVEVIHEKGKSVADRLDQPANYELEVFGNKVKAEYDPHNYGGKVHMASVNFKGSISETGYKSDYLYAYMLDEGISKHGSLRDYLQVHAEKMFLGFNKTVRATVGDKLLKYAVAGGEMLVRAIEGEFPKYAEIIPKRHPVKIRFNPETFLQNLDGALPLDNTLVLKVNGALVMQAESSDKGTFRAQIPCETKGKGKGQLVLKFNAGYLVDAIKAYADREVVLEVKETNGKEVHPCLVNSKAVVMPVR